MPEGETRLVVPPELSSSEESSDVDDDDSDVVSSSDSESSLSDGEAIAVPTDFKRRSDFTANDDYARYVRDNIQVGMMVRCCRTYEEVHEGDIGRVIKVSVLFFFFVPVSVLLSVLVLARSVNSCTHICHCISVRTVDTLICAIGNSFSLIVMGSTI